jgi:hypothetical protein
MAKGLAQTKIAETLGLKHQTVRGYVKNLYRKLGIHKNTDLMILDRFGDVTCVPRHSLPKLTPQERALRRNCYALYKLAIKIGFLIRADKCSICDSVEGVEGHHQDYTRPLDVVWLCGNHHRIAHRNL